MGWWIPGRETGPPDTAPEALARAVHDIGRAFTVVQYRGRPAVAAGGTVHIVPSPETSTPADDGACPVLAHVPALLPENMGDPLFRSAHGLRYAYVVGAMANGITSVKMVEAAAKAGMTGFFGAAGLSAPDIEAAIDQLSDRLGDLPFGMNLIHSPNDPEHEAATVDLYLRRGVRRVSASAYLTLTAPLVRYRVTGIHRSSEGEVVCPNRIFAKVSRVEVAEKFFLPPPEKLLRQLVRAGHITAEEAEMAREIPMAEDMTAEADSGGHTDNRPALAMLPTMIALRDRVTEGKNYPRPIRVGLGGGIATPESAAAAFAMGAAYLVVGSVHQACVESGASAPVREMLAEARQADIIMAPAADMFEMGVRVQVLKRGTMFALRAAKLYEIYQNYDRWESVPASLKIRLEKDFFRSSFADAWRRTHDFFQVRDPRQNERAARDPRHLMALVFRSYLGQSSRWAIAGVPERRMDYQIWCGPAMGAFNEWTRGSFLEHPENRATVTVALNLLAGAAIATRVNWLRCQGIFPPPGQTRIRPKSLEDLKRLTSGEPLAARAT